MVSTPFYLSAWSPVKEALSRLAQMESPLPIRHWLSFKTHPVQPLVRSWCAQGLGVEVVSEAELVAALAEQAPAILVNGPLKDTWLGNCSAPYLRIHFDSVKEVINLARHAKRLSWQVGFRFYVSESFDPDSPHHASQFGMDVKEARVALDALRAEGLNPTSVHFHLRSNVGEPEPYQRSLSEMADACADLGLRPDFIDLGGGMPVPGEAPLGGKGEYPDMAPRLSAVLANIPRSFPSAKEIWLENGRYLTGRSAVLALTVCDVKERSGLRILMCDGGRTNHALVSDWERHDLISIPERCGEQVLTTVAGPTCMAYDFLVRTYLPNDIEVGDVLVWMAAGAYHLSWETRFSRGYCPVVWCDSSMHLSIEREGEGPNEWWSVWKGASPKSK